MSRIVVETEIAGLKVSLENGWMAKQANGAVVVRVGDTMVLATAVASTSPREGGDFLPLTCDYLEKTYSAGKIPGGFFKREGRPSEKEVLTSRLIDRPLRPLFPKGYYNEVQIMAQVLSKDDTNEADVLAITGASAALHISNIPFNGPLAAVRVGYIDGQFIINPTHEQSEKSELDLVVAGSREAIVMVEGEAKFVPEEIIAQALVRGHAALQPLIRLQEELREKVGLPKDTVKAVELPADLLAQVKNMATPRITANLNIQVKQERYRAFAKLREDLLAELNAGRAADDPLDPGAFVQCFNHVESEIMRHMILAQKRRIDGRSFDQVRPITIDVGLLPRTHGSALFTRGETQALVTVTLGTSSDEQKIEGLMGEEYRRFLLHYNFPPFSVGEAKPLRSPGRREIGHGNLARRAINLVLPAEENFPYTMRVVSDILESNGSSSMATVCGASLALMDAGIPTNAAVAGVAMGLVKGENDFAILTDILGDEDHLGDMDFKVCGSEKGVTAIQMDIKVTGITEPILAQALRQARDGRLHILGKMKDAIAAPRPDLSPYAPRITTLKIPVDKIRDVIGPGGKVIRGIIEQTGVKIDVEDDGRVMVASNNSEAASEAIRMIKELTAVPEVGKFYYGKVVRIEDFGAFVRILPGLDGLIHISQLDNRRVNTVDEVVRVGDDVLVKVIEIDEERGRIRLSRKAALGLNPKDVVEDL